MKWTVPRVARGRVVELVQAVTVSVKALPAVAVAGALTTKWVAAAALTVMVSLVPVIELVAVSVAVIVWLPAVLSVALNVWTPLSLPVPDVKA